MTKLIVRCEQCGGVFIVPDVMSKEHVFSFSYSINTLGYINNHHTKEIKHDCSQLNDKLKDSLSGKDREEIADLKIAGICKVIGILKN